MNPLDTPVPQLMAPQDPWTPPPMTPQGPNIAQMMTSPANAINSAPSQNGNSWITAIVQALQQKKNAMGANPNIQYPAQGPDDTGAS